MLVLFNEYLIRGIEVRKTYKISAQYVKDPTCIYIIRKSAMLE